MSTETLAPWLTAKQVADQFQVTVRTIRRWRRNGYFPPPVKIGGSLRWRASDVTDFPLRKLEWLSA